MRNKSSSSGPAPNINEKLCAVADKPDTGDCAVHCVIVAETTGRGQGGLCNTTSPVSDTQCCQGVLTMSDITRSDVFFAF